MDLNCECPIDSPAWNMPHIVIARDIEEHEATVFAVFIAHPVFVAAKDDLARYADAVEGVEELTINVVGFTTPSEVRSDVNELVSYIEGEPNRQTYEQELAEAYEESQVRAMGVEL